MMSLAVLLFVSSADVALAATRYWVGRGSVAADNTRWENTHNWSSTSGGASGASIPTAADIVIFDKNGGRNAQIRSNVSIAGLMITSSYTGSLLQGTGRLAIGTSGWRVGSGRFIGGNAPIALSGSYTQTGGIVSGLMNTLSVSGSIAISKGGSSVHSTITSTGTILFDGYDADQNFTVGADVTKSFKNLTIHNSAGTTSDDIIVNVNGGLFLSGALTVTLGNLDLATNDMALVVDRGITLADAAQATLTTDSNVTASGTILVNDAATITVTAGTWTLNDDGDQDVDLDGQALYNLTVNNTGGGTNDDVVIAGGILNVDNNLTVTLGNIDLTTNSLALDVDNNVSIAAAAQASLTAGDINVGKNFTLNTGGIFTQSSGTATFDGTSQTLSGAITFYNFVKNPSSSDTISFSDAGLITVSNSLTFGGSTSTAQLSIRSVTSGRQWYLNAPSTQTIINLDVKDSRVVNSSNSVICRSGCTDNGNNTNWVFLASASTTTDSSGSTGGVSGSGGGGRRAGSIATLPTITPTATAVNSPAASYRAQGGPTSGVAESLMRVRDRMAERIAKRIAQNPSIAPFLNRLLERLDARIASKLKKG